MNHNSSAFLDYYTILLKIAFLPAVPLNDMYPLYRMSSKGVHISFCENRGTKIEKCFRNAQSVVLKAKNRSLVS